MLGFKVLVTFNLSNFFEMNEVFFDDLMSSEMKEKSP